MGALLAVGGIGGLSVSQAEPISRKGGPAIKVGCAAYSYRKYLKGDKVSMTLEDFLETAAEIRCDGVELTSYYFPVEGTSAYINKLKRKAFLLGLDVSGTAVGNRFTFPLGDQRDAQIADVKKWINYGAEMGAPCLRIFAGPPPEGTSRDEASRWVVECIQECLPVAEEKGVILALENHGGVTSSADEVLSILKAVDSDWLCLNLDTGNFRTEDLYADIAKVAAYSVTTHFKTQVQPAGKSKQEADLARIVRILRDAGYRGYLTLEYEAEEDPKTAVPKAIRRMKEATA